MDIFIFGEVLFDVYENGEEKLGGAPFNVAWHLKGFGMEPQFISSIGCDKRGEKVIALMEKWQLNTTGITKTEKYHTGVVNVYTDRNGPFFKIPYNQAFDHIRCKIDLEKLKNKNAQTLLYHGSLALRSDENLRVLNRIKDLLTPEIFIDINLRAPWWEAHKLYPLIKDANYLKLNNFEFFDLFHSNANNNSLMNICEQYQLSCVILTKGEDGANIVTKDGTSLHYKKVLDENFVDSVGAGDAFSAVTIYGLLNKWDYKKILTSAVEFAAHICTIKGALPDHIDIYKKFLQEWGTDE